MGRRRRAVGFYSKGRGRRRKVIPITARSRYVTPEARDTVQKAGDEQAWWTRRYPTREDLERIREPLGDTKDPEPQLMESWLKSIPEKDRKLARIEVTGKELFSLSGRKTQGIANMSEKTLIVSTHGYEGHEELLARDVAHETGHFVYNSLPEDSRAEWMRATEKEGSAYEDYTKGEVRRFAESRAGENFAAWYMYKLHPGITATLSELEGVYPKTGRLFKKIWNERYGVEK